MPTGTNPSKRKTKFSVPGKPTEDRKKLFAKKEGPLVTAPPPEQSLTPSPMDLTTLDNVKDYLGIDTDNDDNLLQSLITANGFYWLWFCGLGNQNGVNTQSPLNSVCSFTDTYDGNGSNRFYLRNRPIISVASLQINGVSIPQSSGYGQAGFLIDGDAKSLAIQQGSAGATANFSFQGWPWPQSGPYFQKGIQNILVNYSAGFEVTPFDVELASKQTVALTWQKKGRQDVASEAMAMGAGTISFRNFTIPPEALKTMIAYQRQSMY